MSRRVERHDSRAAVAVVFVLVAAIIYIYVNVLGGQVLTRPKHVAVELAETGGLFTGSAVSYRGVRVGAVDDIRLSGDGAVADVRLNPDAEVPADSMAVVRSLSPAGEQYLDFQPDQPDGPYLADGSRIAATSTSTPSSVAQTLKSVDRLMSQIDEKSLRTILHETNAAFASPEDLGRVVKASADLVDVLDEVWPETDRLLTNSEVVLRSGVASSKDFRDFAQSSRDVAKWLKDFDPVLRHTVDVAPDQLVVMRRFVNQLVRIVPPMLQDYVRLTGILASHDPHARQLLKEFPIGFEALTSVFDNGRLRANMLLSRNGVCSYGLTDTNPQLGPDHRRPFDHDLQCPRSFPLQQRGSAWRPGPTR